MSYFLSDQISFNQFRTGINDGRKMRLSVYCICVSVFLEIYSRNCVVALAGKKSADPEPLCIHCVLLSSLYCISVRRVVGNGDNRTIASENKLELSNMRLPNTHKYWADTVTHQHHWSHNNVASVKLPVR